MNILFITSTRIGDAVLSTGVLNHLISAHPSAKITVACGPLVKGFFEPIKQVERVISLKKEKCAGHWCKLWPLVIITRWDIIVDLRNSAVSRLVFAKKRYVFGRNIDKSLHKAQQNAAVMKLDYVPDLRLWFSEEMKKEARRIMGRQDDAPALNLNKNNDDQPHDNRPHDDNLRADRPIIAIGPAANWRAKTWPAESFMDMIRQLTNPSSPHCILPHARIAVIAASEEKEQALPVLNSIPEERRIDLIGKGSPEFASACISLCDFYIGNDSGLMHCAAATGIPTFGLFGPSWPRLYSPWGRKTAYISTPKDFKQLTDYKGYSAKTAPCLMEGLSVEDVVEAIKIFWQSGAK